MKWACNPTPALARKAELAASFAAEYKPTVCTDWSQITREQVLEAHSRLRSWRLVADELGVPEKSLAAYRVAKFGIVCGRDAPFYRPKVGSKLVAPGDTFGRLRVIERAESDDRTDIHWRCVCVCGNEATRSTTSLRVSDIPSCGCYKAERLAQIAENRRSGKYNRPPRSCETPGCNGKYVAKGLCMKCYNAAKRRLSPAT